MPCKRLGFVLSQLGVNQISYDVLRSSNDYLAKADDVDISLYWCNDGIRVIQPNFATMPLFELYGYNGNAIATDLHCISRILNYPGPSRNKIFYYLYDLDWLRLGNKQYEQLKEIYLNSKVNLIARSEQHREIIESCWKKCVAVVEGCNIEKFKELV